MSRLRSLRPTILDSYVVREVTPPTLLGLLLFSFILMLEAISRLMGILVSRGADLQQIFQIFLNLLPSILATTVPMSFLLGVLLAFGRMAADSEVIAMRASGVSVSRLLRPVILLSLLTAGVTSYIMSTALPRANQAYREDLFALVISKARSGIQPRVFTDDLLPGMVLYVSDIPAETGKWRNVFLHDSPTPETPRVIMAAGGEPVIDYEERRAHLRLEQGVIHTFNREHPGRYEEQRFSSFEKPLNWDQLFPRAPLSRGDREMTPEELQAKIAELRAEGAERETIAPWIVEWHKRYAIPVACLVFGMLGLGLSMGSKREARSAAFGLSVAVIFVYYVLIRLGEQAGDTGMLPPVVSMWGANAILGALAIGLLVLNHREAAFDPLDPTHYAVWLPRMRRARSGAQTPRPEPGTGTEPQRRPVRFVLRVPRLALPAPSLLDRYVAKAYFGHLVLVLISFWAIYLLANFMDLFDDIQQNRVKGIDVIRYYAYHNPQIVYLMLPVAALVTPLVTFGVLSRRNEMTAIKAGGISIYRAVVPVVLLGAALSGTLFALGDYVLPYTNRIAQRYFNVIKGRPPQTTNLLEQRWILGSDDRIYNYDYLSEGRRRDRGVAAGGMVFEETQLFGLTVFGLDRQAWELRDVLYVNRAVWQGGNYGLERGWRLQLGGDRPGFRTFTASQTREIEEPGYFMQEAPESDTLRLDQLAGYIEMLEARGLDVTKLRVQMQRKVAFPTVSLVMTLIGIPFAFVVGRRGALYGIGISILIAIVYWACLSIFEALGNSALLPPLLAAWAPNLLFGAAGLYMMLTLDT